MPWFNVDDGFAFHQKAIRAGNSAIGLWTRAGSWSAHQLTEGFVPAAIVSSLGTFKQAQRLVAVGLWLEVDGGYLFHEWTADGRNPTREQVLERRRKDREKKEEVRRKAREKAANSGEPQVDGRRPHGTDEGHPGGVPEGIPKGVGATTPLHSTPKKEDSLRESSPRKRGTRIPDDFAVTPDMVAWAREHTPDVDGRRATESFMDYWRGRTGKDATKLDWTATWRNWLRREQERAERGRPRAAPNGYQSQTDANIAAFLGVDQQPHLKALPGGAS